jgi:hypothetical protein
MNTVVSQIGGQVGPVVQNERHIVAPGDRQQRLRGTPDLGIRGRTFLCIFQAKLQTGDIVNRQGVIERLRKSLQARAFQTGGTDQVEAAARRIGVVCRNVVLRGDQNLP